jgi:hypothetical protein
MRRDGAKMELIWGKRSGLFLPRNLDDPNHVELASEIRSLAQRFSWVGLASRAVARPERLMV